MSQAKAKARVKEHFRVVYDKRLDDLVVSDVPGYWMDKKPVDLSQNGRHPGYSNYRASYAYFDPPRDKKGRFSSPTKTWRIIYEKQQNE